MPGWFGCSTLNPDPLIPPEEQWRPQWNRVIRWHSRVTKIRTKSRFKEPTANDIDDVIAFLQNCYHLRDWIKSTRPEFRQKIDLLFKSNFELSACRDVCNGFKHKRITKPSHDSDFNLYREYEHFALEENPVKYRIAFAYGNDIKKFDLFAFTDSCFRLWERFIVEEIEKESKITIGPASLSAS